MPTFADICRHSSMSGYVGKRRGSLLGGTLLLICYMGYGWAIGWWLAKKLKLCPVRDAYFFLMISLGVVCFRYCFTALVLHICHKGCW